jgi:hypothetical protein
MGGAWRGAAAGRKVDGKRLGLAEVPVGGGFPGWFTALFVIVAVAGIGVSIWRFSVLRSGGLNPFVAREQLEARLNQSLNQPPPAEPDQSVEQRLAELDDLYQRGMITDTELAAGRAGIIAGN